MFFTLLKIKYYSSSNFVLLIKVWVRIHYWRKLTSWTMIYEHFVQKSSLENMLCITEHIFLFLKNDQFWFNNIFVLDIVVTRKRILSQSTFPPFYGILHFVWMDVGDLCSEALYYGERVQYFILVIVYL